MTIDCLNAAKYFIAKAYEDGMEAEMTNMKVQKLLYYAQSLHLALYDETLFAEEIQAWRYGPVCPPAYKFYSDFEARQLPIPDKEHISNISNEERDVLAEVWEYFGHYHAYRLSDMTHFEFPWIKARQGLPSEASSNEPIQIADLKELGRQKLRLIELEHPAYESTMFKVLKDSLDSKPSNLISKGEVRDWLNSLLD